MESEILDLFRECTRRIEREVEGLGKENYGKRMGMGADGTPIKGIDEKAESTAIEFFQDNCEYAILSEETGVLEGENGTIIMDPIDGTSNSVLGIPFYSVSLAYTPDGFSDISVGYVKNLPLDKEYYAVKGEGSYVDGKEMRPELTEDWNFSVYMGKKAHPDNHKVAYMSRRTRSLGSAAIEISMVAEGVFDLYLMRTPDEKRSLRITDVAAASVILREAGGEVYDGEFEQLDMPLDLSYRSDTIAVHDYGIMEEVKEVIG